MKLQMKLRIESPVAISSSFSGNINETLDFIPGTVIRGMLADAFLKENDMHDPERKSLFKQLFLSEDVIYNNFYREGSRPIPFTARTCKTFSGFKRYLPEGKNSPVDKEDSHGIRDCLLDFLLYEETRESEVLQDECSCGLPLERYSGYYDYSFRDACYYEVPISKREITRTEIFGKTQTSLHGILFTIEVIEEGQIFEGSIEVKNSSLESALRQSLNRDKIFFVGIGKSRGLGRVGIMSEELVFLPVKDINNDERVRFGLFNQKIMEKFSDKKITNVKPYFSITLLSDAIIQQKDKRYLSVITPEFLKIENFGLKLSFCSHRKISGWSNIWRLPKKDDIAISKGSVFLYKSEKELNGNELSLLQDTLERLEADGIGKRRNEGFGKISVCDSFHWRECNES